MILILSPTFIHREKLNEVHDELQKKEADLAELQPDDSQNREFVGFFGFAFFFFLFLKTYVIKHYFLFLLK